MAKQNFFNKALRLFMLLLLWPFWVAAVVMAFDYANTVDHSSINQFWLAVGASTLFFAITWDVFRFWAKLEHELAHAVLARSFLLSIVELFVYRKDDPEKKKQTMVIYAGPFVALIALAPYYLPLLTLPLLVIHPLIAPPYETLYEIGIGISLGFHYGTTIRELSIPQTDLKDTGPLYSIIVILVLNVVFLVIIVAVVTNDYAAILAYFRATFELAMAYYRQTIDAWQSGQIQAEIDRILGLVGL